MNGAILTKMSDPVQVVSITEAYEVIVRRVRRA
jgi:hypothetical protein